MRVYEDFVHINSRKFRKIQKHSRKFTKVHKIAKNTSAHPLWRAENGDGDRRKEDKTSKSGRPDSMVLVIR